MEPWRQPARHCRPHLCQSLRRINPERPGRVIQQIQVFRRQILNLFPIGLRDARWVERAGRSRQVSFTSRIMTVWVRPYCLRRRTPSAFNSAGRAGPRSPLSATTLSWRVRRLSLAHTARTLGRGARAESQPELRADTRAWGSFGPASPRRR